MSKQRYAITIEYRPELNTYLPWRYHVSRVNRTAVGETVQAVQSGRTDYKVHALLKAHAAIRRDTRTIRRQARPYHREVMR